MVKDGWEFADALNQSQMLHTETCRRQVTEWEILKKNTYCERHKFKNCFCETSFMIPRPKCVDCKTLGDCIKELRAKEKRWRFEKSSVSYRHIWITISLNPEKFNVNLIKNWVPTLSCCTEGATCWVIELFGKELKFHPHIHLLIRTTKTLDRKRIIAALAKSFKLKSNFVDYVFGTNKHLYQKRLSYVKGLKTDSKNLQCNADAEFREKNDIQCYYSL